MLNHTRSWQNPEESQLTRFSGTFRYSRRAVELVWQTSHHLTVGLALLTLCAGILPAVAAYLGQLIVDAVVAASSAFRAQTNSDASWNNLLNLGWPVLRVVLLEALVIATLAACQRGISVIQSLLRAQLGQRVNVMILFQRKIPAKRPAPI